MKKKGLYILTIIPNLQFDEQALQYGVKLFVHGTFKMLNLTTRGLRV